jgi:hypothetical protein
MLQMAQFITRDRPLIALARVRNFRHAPGAHFVNLAIGRGHPPFEPRMSPRSAARRRSSPGVRLT